MPCLVFSMTFMARLRSLKTFTDILLLKRRQEGRMNKDTFGNVINRERGAESQTVDKYLSHKITKLYIGLDIMLPALSFYRDQP